MPVPMKQLGDRTARSAEECTPELDEGDPARLDSRASATAVSTSLRAPRADQAALANAAPSSERERAQHERAEVGWPRFASVDRGGQSHRAAEPRLTCVGRTAKARGSDCCALGHVIRCGRARLQAPHTTRRRARTKGMQRRYRTRGSRRDEQDGQTDRRKDFRSASARRRGPATWT